jgi:NAD(P)-dependent dehydrogenase (short-subunit alcohol dehydrogenase family)
LSRANRSRRRVRAPFFLTAAIAPKTAARGSGSIVNVATMAAHFGLPGASAYGASKAAVVSLTQTWPAEYGPQGVRVNAVSAGTTRTEGTAGMGDDLDPTRPDVTAAASGEPRGDCRGDRVPGLPALELHQRRHPPRGRRPHGGLAPAREAASPRYEAAIAARRDAPEAGECPELPDFATLTEHRLTVLGSFTCHARSLTWLA